MVNGDDNYSTGKIEVQAGFYNQSWVIDRDLWVGCVELMEFRQQVVGVDNEGWIVETNKLGWKGVEVVEVQVVVVLLFQSVCRLGNKGRPRATTTSSSSSSGGGGRTR